MLTEETKRRQERLNKQILNLSKKLFDDVEIRKTLIELKGIYSAGFRHNYSEFFPLILDISKEDNLYNLDFLSNNLEELRRIVEKSYVSGEKEFTKIYHQLEKLCDHLNLEIGRLSYYSQNEKKIIDIEAKTSQLNKNMMIAIVDLKEASLKASSIQTELIAVLSIFAAIVITFSGGISFIGNAIEGISKVNIFKLTFALLICGLVLFNTIFLMMYLVGKIIGRNIYADCQSENCNCGVNGKPNCKSLKRIRKRLPYVFYFNVSLVSMLILDIVIWFLLHKI